jgi:hypothetical protein
MTWQWVDKTRGPMGWFSDEEKRGHEGTAEFQDGEWHEVSEAEVTEQRRWLARLSYDQS